MFSISGEVLCFSVFCVFFPVSVFTICDARALGIFFSVVVFPDLLFFFAFDL